jgi:Skp family chaperone for outer membrane proteins
MLPFTFRQALALAGVVTFAVCVFWAHVLGGKAVQRDWDAEKAQTVLDQLAAEKVARAKEQELTKKANDVQAKLNAEKKRAAAAAGAAADELRLLQEALAASAAARDSSAPSGVDGASVSGLLLECGKSYSGVAADADTLANKVTGLQGYVRDVCQSSSSGK